jgi:hypothetical protein
MIHYLVVVITPLLHFIFSLLMSIVLLFVKLNVDMTNFCFDKVIERLIMCHVYFLI